MHSSIRKRDSCVEYVESSTTSPTERSLCPKDCWVGSAWWPEEFGDLSPSFILPRRIAERSPRRFEGTPCVLL